MSIYNLLINDEKTIDNALDYDKDQEIANSILSSFDRSSMSPYNIVDIKDDEMQEQLVLEVLSKLTSIYGLNVQQILDSYTGTYLVRIASSLYNVFKKDSLHILTKIISKDLFENMDTYIDTFDINFKEATKENEDSRNLNTLLTNSILTKKYISMILEFMNNEEFRKKLFDDNEICEDMANDISKLIEDKSISGKYALDYEIFSHVLVYQHKNFLYTSYNRMLELNSDKLKSRFVMFMIEHWNLIQGQIQRDNQPKRNNDHLSQRNLFKNVKL